MFGPSFGDYYREALKKVQQDILHESDAQILGTKVEDFANFYFQKYALFPLEFNKDDVSYDIKKEVRRVAAHERDYSYRGEGDINWEYELVAISVPIRVLSSENLEWIKKLSGPTRSLDGFDEEIVYSQEEVSYSFDIKGYGVSMNEDQIAREINTTSQRLLGIIIQKNSIIEAENPRFLENIKNLIVQRKTKLTEDKERIYSLAQKIKIPLKQKVVPGATKIIPQALLKNILSMWMVVRN